MSVIIIAMTDKPVAPSAPAYEPEKWNSAVTPEYLKKFLDQNKDFLQKVTQRDGYRYANAFGSEGFNQADHRERAAKIEGLAGEVRRHFGLFRQDDPATADAKLAQYYGIDPKDVGRFKEVFEQYRKDAGYEKFATCYTYAMNDNDGIDSWWAGESGRPGSRAEVDQAMNEAENARDYPAFQRAVMKGLVADGATEGGMDAQPKEGYYRVAVYTLYNDKPSGDSSLYDYHFVRENQGGGWSHKFGTTPVTDVDRDGKKIEDPKAANFGRYQFMGFVYVPEGGLDVGSPHEPKTKPGSIEAKKYETSAAQIPDMDAMTAQVLSAMRLPPVPRPESAPILAEQRRAPKPEFMA